MFARKTSREDEPAEEGAEKPTKEKATVPAGPTLKPEDEPHAYTSFATTLGRAIRETEAAIAAAREELGAADAEYAKWSPLMGIPGLSSAGKTAYIQPHHDHWKARSNTLRSAVTVLETKLTTLNQVATHLSKG